jgi:SAM-dependent methyltransferase
LERFRYFDIALHEHVVCNPTSIEKLDRVIRVLDLPAGARMLDIACGKGEFLARVVERYGCSAVGVDLSPYTIGDAHTLVAERLPGADIELIHGDGAGYDGPYATFDLVSCLGASWIWKGHRGTLRALARWARPGGLVLAGEPFWIADPPDEYLRNDGLSREMFGTHHDNVRTGVDLGLTPVYSAVSNHDEWDHYETLQWRAVERWARTHPGDPDRAEVLETSTRNRETYLRWGRDTLGWALYLFRK